MDRLGFLKQLGALIVGATIMPDLLMANKAIPAELPKPKIPDGVWKNEMTIQRKTVKVTGQPVLIHWKDTIGNNYTVVHHPMFDGDLENYKNSSKFKVTQL